MEQLQKFWAESPLASYLRTFLSIVAFEAITEFVRLGHFDFSNLETWVIAGLVPFLAVLSRYKNPQDALG